MGASDTPEKVKQWRDLYAGIATGFWDRSPNDFEKFVATLFEWMGYSTTITPISSDYGADVIAKKSSGSISIQVKRYDSKHLVGVQDVNQVLGSMHKYNTEKAILVTTSGFTNSAKKMARTAPLELWDQQKLYEMIEQHFFSTPKERQLVSIMFELEKERAKTLLRVAADGFKRITEILKKPSSENGKTKPLISATGNPRIPLTQESIGKEALFKTRVKGFSLVSPDTVIEKKIDRIPFDYEFRLRGYSFLGKVLQSEGIWKKGMYKTNGEILEIQMMVTSLFRQRVPPAAIRNTLVLIDKEDFIYRPGPNELQQMAIRSNMFSGIHGIGFFSPKIPVECSVFFEVPHSDDQYHLTATDDDFR